MIIIIQPVSYKRYFRCNNCVLLLLYAINLSLSTDLVDPYSENTSSVKPPLLYLTILTVSNLSLVQSAVPTTKQVTDNKYTF